MRKMKIAAGKKAATSQPISLKLRNPADAARALEPFVHVLKKGCICRTDTRGYVRPNNLSPWKIVLDATNGFVPLWAQNVTLRWRFQTKSLLMFEDPAGIKATIEELLGEALLAWGDAAPVRFTQAADRCDFEIVVKTTNDCDPAGCTLASAFFPDGGQHELTIFPMMFDQSEKDQVNTLTHEIGHIFGLRHFFANVSETAWPSTIFGKHKKFSIMNYGELSKLSADDKADLKRLYQKAWSGELTSINGTPIRLMKPFSAPA